MTRKNNLSMLKLLPTDLTNIIYDYKLGMEMAERQEKLDAFRASLLNKHSNYYHFIKTGVLKLTVCCGGDIKFNEYDKLLYVYKNNECPHCKKTIRISHSVKVILEVREQLNQDFVESVINNI